MAACSEKPFNLTMRLYIPCPTRWPVNETCRYSPEARRFRPLRLHKGKAMNEVASCEELASQQVSRRRVAIIGSGPGGLVAARYLQQHGFQPEVFEQDDDNAGAWDVRSTHS